MEFGPITVKDKLGREVVLRNAKPEDAEDLINYLKVTTAETPYLIREPDEFKLNCFEMYLNLSVSGGIKILDVR